MGTNDLKCIHQLILAVETPRTVQTKSCSMDPSIDPQHYTSIASIPKVRTPHSKAVWGKKGSPCPFTSNAGTLLHASLLKELRTHLGAREVGKVCAKKALHPPRSTPGTEGCLSSSVWETNWEMELKN